MNKIKFWLVNNRILLLGFVTGWLIVDSFLISSKLVFLVFLLLMYIILDFVSMLPQYKKGI